MSNVAVVCKKMDHVPTYIEFNLYIEIPFDINTNAGDKDIIFDTNIIKIMQTFT